MRIHPTVSLTLATLTFLAACHQGSAPHATAQDLEATKQEVQQEVSAARVEASKDIKSAAKVAGADSRNVMEAKATGAYDVAMTKAEGDHKIATEQCLTLEASMQQACKDQADADYESAKAAAKATRLARRQ